VPAARGTLPYSAQHIGRVAALRSRAFVALKDELHLIEGLLVDDGREGIIDADHFAVVANVTRLPSDRVFAFFD
jgi:hypothetical protein